MITYHYKCTSCEDLVEIQQSIKDAPITHCDVCGKESLQRIISGGSDLLIKADPKTVGLLAARNSQKFGRQYVEEKSHEIRTRGKEGRKFVGKLPQGATPIERPKDKKVWWRKGEQPDLSLANLTTKQKIDYIYKGIKPNAKSN